MKINLKMEHQEPDRAITYQRKMQALYNRAADVFKQQYSPADPFDGVLIAAEYLEVSELAAVFKAAKALEDEGNAAFVQNLVLYRGSHTTPMVRVNSLYLDALRQRKHEICEYLYKVCFEFDSVEEVLGYEQKIVDINDPQLTKYFRQAQEALAVEAEVIQDAE